MHKHFEAEPAPLDHPAVELHLTLDTPPSRRDADFAVRALERNASPPASLLGRLFAPVILGSYVADRLDPTGSAPTGPDGSWPISQARRRATDAIG